MTTTERIDTHFDKLGIAPPTESSPDERLVIPGGIRECIVLRARGVGAQYTQAGHVTIPARELPKAQRLITQAGVGTWLEDGRRLIGRGV